MKLPHSVQRILVPFAVLLFVLLLYETKLVYHQKFEANLLPPPDGQDSDEDRWVRAAEAVPSAPAQLMQWHLSQENIRERVSLPLCQQMPEPWRISVANEHWQLLRLEQHNVFLFSAHHDRRMEKSPYVRIITMMNRAVPSPNDIRCLLWYRSKLEPSIVDVVDIQQSGGMGVSTDDLESAYLVTCPYDDSGGIPQAVSLISAADTKCQKTTSNCLKINHFEYNNTKRNIAMCEKAVSYQDSSMVPRLVEWIELLFILGVEKIFFHYTHLHPEIINALSLYQSRGLLDLVKYTWAGPFSTDPHLEPYYRQRLEVMTRQDNVNYMSCFYRALEEGFRYLAVFDVDEVVMPLQHSNWLDMLDVLETIAPEDTKGFSFANTYFMDSMGNATSDDIPDHHHMLLHLVRMSGHTGDDFMKSIVRVRDADVKTLGAHYPTSCAVPYECATHDADPELAHLAHYREGCQRGVSKAQCTAYASHTVEDSSIVKFKDELVARVEHTLGELSYS